MKVCFPVADNEGIESEVFGHFGSAPLFLLVDTVTNEITAIPNPRVHQGAGCNPVSGLAGHQIDAVVVGGIGGGALSKLNAAGIRVFQAGERTISRNIALLQGSQLEECVGGGSCGGHGHGHGGHGHDHGCSH